MDTTVYRDAVIVHHRLTDMQYRQSDGMPKKRSARDRSEFGERMHAARVAAGLTQMEVRAAIGCSQSTLSELEGTAQSTGLVTQFAELYKVSPKWLATGEGAREAAGRPAPSPPGETELAWLLAIGRKLSPTNLLTLLDVAASMLPPGALNEGMPPDRPAGLRLSHTEAREPDQRTLDA